MECRDLLVANWNVGEYLTFLNKKYTRYDKIIPQMVVNVKLGSCDLTGDSVRAYFISPIAEVDAIVATSVISEGKAIFNLEGNVLQDYGKWKVELVLLGQNGESRGTTDRKIEYTVVETVEGNGEDVQPTSDTQNTVGELVEELESKIEEANGMDETLKETITSATDTKEELEIVITSAEAINETLGETTTTANQSKADLETEISKVPSEIQKITDQGDIEVQKVIDQGQVYQDGIDENKEHITIGGYETITDISQDIELKEGYYEIVDNKNNQYSVRVDSDLFISEGNVIENIAGYVRLKGVKMPCKLVIRQFPTLTNNTKYSFLELNSNFPSSEAIKSLIKEVI